SRADPRRARSGPRRRTDPRSLPTRTGSGRSVTTDSQRTRKVDVPAPETVAPRPCISCTITSTSRIRGMFVRTHSSSLNRHAASSGSAEFLLPSTATLPSSRRPPSILNVAMSVFPEIHDFLAKVDTESIPDRRLTACDQPADVGGRRATPVHDEVAMSRRDDGVPLARPLQAGTIDERSGGRRDSFGYLVSRGGRGLG